MLNLAWFEASRARAASMVRSVEGDWVGFGLGGESRGWRGAAEAVGGDVLRRETVLVVVLVLMAGGVG